MDQETLGRTIGWAGVILGTLLGILGGAIGVYFSVRNTKGPRERAFVIRASILCLIGVLLFVVGKWLIPSPYKFGLVAVYVVALLLTIRHWNKRQAAIRAEESNRAAPSMKRITRAEMRPHSPVLQKPCALIAVLVLLMALAGCNIAGGIGEQHIPDANYNDGENYVICFQLTAPGGDASKAFTEAYIVLEGVRAPMTKTEDTKYRVEFEYKAKTADLVGKIPKYHFEYSGGKTDRFMNRMDRSDRRNFTSAPARSETTTPDGYRVCKPTKSVSKPVSAEPDAVYDSIEQIKFDPPIVRYEMGKPYTYKQFEATLYDKDNNVVGQLKPYSYGGWYISYSDENRPITVFKRKPHR